jgi:WXXGXW repeat (2 copies)
MDRSPTLSRLLARAAVVGLAGAALAGCIAVPVGTYQQQPYQGEVVPVPPPAPQYETIGVAPYPGWIWISGYWGWKLNRHVWIGGRWDAPRHGHRWVPPQWHQHGGGWRQAPGRWAR